MTIREITSSVPVRNKHRDAREAVIEAYGSIPAQWKRLVPEFETVLADMPLSEVPEIKDEFEGRMRQRSAEKMTACTVFDEDGADRIYVSSKSFAMSRSYAMKSAYVAEVARLAILNSKSLSKAVRDAAKGTPVEHDPRGTLNAFRHNFAEFVLDPSMKRRKSAEYAYMERLDALAKNGGISPN